MQSDTHQPQGNAVNVGDDGGVQSVRTVRARARGHARAQAAGPQAKTRRLALQMHLVQGVELPDDRRVDVITFLGMHARLYCYVRVFVIVIFVARCADMFCKGL